MERDATARPPAVLVVICDGGSAHSAEAVGKRRQVHSGLNLTKKALHEGELDFDGAPNGTRTRVTALKGQCPRPLDDGDAVQDSIAEFMGFVPQFVVGFCRILRKRKT